MTNAEKVLRDRIIKRWMERHATWRQAFDTGISGEAARVTFWDSEDRWCYTTVRMFDGKFWSFRYRWQASTRSWVLIKTSLRRHGKRKAAKERAYYAGHKPDRPERA